ncbi:MAG TPA: sensor histidine kinase [Ktedonobacterales bacterium]|nr:sensor histidine kinase [Ktedonobacterales bacterium]
MRKRWRWRFGGLSWRIMVSYFLVTLVAALTIEFAMTLGAFLQDLQAPVQPSDQVLSQREERAASQITRYLERAVPDTAALQRWLLGSFLNAVSTAGSGEPSFLVIVDQHGQTLAAVSCASPVFPKPEKSFSPQIARAGIGSCTAITAAQAAVLLSPAYTQAALSAALEGTLRPVEVTAPEKHTIIAASILSSEGQVLGALVSDVTLGTDSVTAASAIATRNIGELISVFLRNLQPAGFYFVLLAMALGTVTGILISGGITRRLRRITLAAGAWSQGEFQVAVRDPSRDELGQLAQDLNRMAEQIQTLLATRQELAVVEERNRLARELHDSVKQHVFANALLIRAARKVFAREPDKAQGYLAEAEELSRQAQQELIDLIRALRPAAIADKGLVGVLEEYTADWSRRMGIVVEMRVQGERTTPLEIETVLFRVTQEALANVARHSNAEQVEVQLAWTDEDVSLTIQDNGQGFDTLRAEGKGMGLGTMRERVEALHGALTISSSASGTRIEARISFSHASPEETLEAVYE